LANLSKIVNKSETSGEFFGKQLPAQRERKEQHQLIVTWKDSNTGFSNGSIGL
jgi:hypothetical protein